MKPKYAFFANTRYALQGAKEIFAHEKSFLIEVIIVLAVNLIALFWEFELSQRLFMLFSSVLVLIVEIINSAIERVVDLVTTEYAELAKNAKDAGSFAVFVSINLAVIVWLCVIGTKILD